jgi:hypothetical protein
VPFVDVLTATRIVDKTVSWRWIEAYYSHSALTLVVFNTNRPIHALLERKTGLRMPITVS